MKYDLPEPTFYSVVPRSMERLAPSVAESGPEREAAWRKALAYGNAEACYLLAKQAGEWRQAEMTRPLCELLTDSLRPWYRRHRGAEWERAREACAAALGQIGDCRAWPDLANALFDPSAKVSEAAAIALKKAGPNAARPLIENLENRIDWTAEQMRRLLDVLGTYRERSATVAILRALDHLAPRAPRRWDRIAVGIPVTMTAPLVLFGGWHGFVTGLGMMKRDPESLANPLSHIFGALFYTMIGFVGGMAPFLPFVALALLVFYLPIKSAVRNLDRNDVTLAALRALAHVGDKFTLPRILVAIHSGNGIQREVARHIAAYLLQLLGPEDAAWISAGDRERMVPLAFSSDETLAVAVLRAFRAVGTGQEIPPVERLSRRNASDAVRAEAAALLPILQMRKANAHAATTLLRAAGSPYVPSSEMVRPVYATPDTDGTQLLRAQSEREGGDL